jgi:hypothetical protein
MNAYPAEHSILVLDNCRIHHNEALVDLVHSAGQLHVTHQSIQTLNIL